jgi:hypothetical protein
MGHILIRVLFIERKQRSIAGRIFDGYGVIAGLNDPLAVMPFGFLDLIAVNPDIAALCNGEITLISSGCRKLYGPPGRGFPAFMSFEFLLAVSQKTGSASRLSRLAA